MPLKKWRSMDIFNFSHRDNPIMESVTNKFTQISQSHAGSLLRHRRLGSLSSVKSEDAISPPKREETTESNQPLLQRTAIIQKDERGYGLTVSGDNPVYVASVKAGGAAERAGVQVDDRIIKVNGKLVVNSNHREVVHLIRAGSYVALTLLGKPPNAGQQTSREPTIDESSGSFRNSITAPLPVDAEKEKDFRQQKANTIRVMYEAAHEEYDKLKKAYKSSQSEKVQAQIVEKEKTLKILEAQLQGVGGSHSNSVRDSQALNVDDTGDNSSVSSWLHKKDRKHMKHSSSPGAMYRPTDTQSKANVNVCRSKSDVSSRKNTLSEYPYGKRNSSDRNESNSERPDSSGIPKHQQKIGLKKTASVPTTVSDLGSDSPPASPSASPTPTQGTDTDTGHADSGIEDLSHPVTMSKANNIIGMDDDEFPSEDECLDVDHRSKTAVSPFLSKLQSFETGDSKVFSDLKQLETKPAHMAIFLHYVLNHHNPSSLLFHMLSTIYSTTQGNPKDLKKWAYEIHSTFLVHQAPLKVHCVKDYMIQEIDSNLQFRAEKEEVLRAIFSKARTAALEDVQKLLEDLRQKKEQGLIEGSNDLREHMDKGEELKVVERYLMQDLDKFVQFGESDEKYNAQSWAIATFLRHFGLHKTSSHSSTLERVQSFVTKDKRSSKLMGKKSKSIKGHQFAPAHLSKQEFCLHCTRVLWGVGFQGYQCQTCDQCVHKHCVDDLKEDCSKSKKKRVSSSLNVFKPKQQQGKATSPTLPTPEGGAVKSALSDIISAATPIISDSEREPMISPTQQSKPNVFTQPLKDAEDAERNAFREGGHSVNNLVNRFETKSPDRETSSKYKHQRYSGQDWSSRHTRRNAISPRQGRRPSQGLPQHPLLSPRSKSSRKADIGRSESMKGRGDLRDRPTRRSKSDVDMDEQTLRAITTSGSSSASSLRSIDSPSSSMDTLTAQINEDSDFDVESELPSLKQVLGEETVRKLRPKEKKRQDVINELFYTEKCHVRNLKILDKLFYRPMLKDQAIIPQDFTKSLFPNLETMISLHGSLNNSMKQRRKEKTVISAVGDLLVARFDGKEGENFRNGCAIFCRNQSHALENLKLRTKKETKMAQMLCDAENNPLCQRLALKDIIPKQFMRLTKYPLLIENLLKYTPTNTDEYTNLERAHQCSKHILEYVNQAVKDCENHQRLIDLQRRIDKKAIDGSPEMEDLRMFDLSKHKLIHDGTLTWRINNRKQIELHVVLLEKAMVLLQKQEERLVLKLQSTQLVAGKEDTKRQSPLLWLNNVLARNDATDRKAFFVVNTSKAGPQIYQLVAGTADEQKRWTKHITQAADSMKKNEINSKNKKQPEEIPVPPPVEQEIKAVENHEPQNLDEQPDDVTILSNDQVISPLEKLRQNDEDLASVLETRINVLAEFLKVNSDEVAVKAQTLVAQNDSDPTELVVACQHQITQLMDLIKDSSIGALQQSDTEEQVESIEDLSLPIPMERLKDMANRMNQILSNLLAQTRATSTALSPVSSSQAAVNSRDEERDRLRRELKFAQDELDRLRRIQKIQLENLAKEREQEGGEPVEGEGHPPRPISMVSETSTTSEAETENKDESEPSEVETDTNDDGMPGLPIEPEVVSELANEVLNEVSPGAIETIPDMESPLPMEDEEPKNVIEAEYEAVEEILHEVEPPDEDQLEDSEIPVLKIENDSDMESDIDDSDDDEEEEESVSDTGDTVTNNVDEIDGTGEQTETLEVSGRNGTDTVSEDASSRLQGEVNDANGEESDESNDKRDSGEIFHDAVAAQDDLEGDKTNLGEDPGGKGIVSVEPDPVNNPCDVDTATISKHSETVSDVDNTTQEVKKSASNSIVVEPVAPVVDNNNVENQSDGNVDCASDSSLIPLGEGDKNGTCNVETSLKKDGDLTDETVTSLTGKEAEQV